jgi:hypothetical protein
MKSGSLNLLEPSGPVKGCNGIALSLPSTLEAIPPSASCGRAMPWWQGITFHIGIVKNACVEICLTHCLQTKFTRLRSDTHNKIGKEERTFMPDVRYRCEAFIKNLRVLLCPFSRNLRVAFLYFSPLFIFVLRLSSTQLGQGDSLINLPFTVRLLPISAVNILALVSGGI